MYLAIRRHKENTYKRKLRKRAVDFLGANLVRIDENGKKTYLDDDTIVKTYAEASSHIPKKSGRNSYSKLMKRVAAKKVRRTTKDILRSVNDFDDFSDIYGGGHSTYKKDPDYKWRVFG